uniref:Uncharacterized protein n=1 Tax=Trieres chinensis TaxID=1514140 RepID=A0A7S2EJ67_TRICV|mmetsp:Transcript_26112/g.53465  ORF Transcript_26112/g.53465 Transcript_26112/m.53465 type:complete len:150 (+) Transcript_26112:132-581(+)|eukprot:CAMPEP_0183295860 /NCGR_PEP_ID=MMETSP0160_2-20130417/3656_1 /TAXON_ID=2839 ORGANISM="Odontella Sinensis, Strain Grunow 1884" /NCGR_SAMPLE_ID=MMETSP0160_2 /ASSEMBLY_ACC=CAM_ASM_000250 /LENGTH=149 /DNA_ID=CAMNT_0025457399 /DNA_START=106 /DNA_END=555 /DNA_ORIENTATION=+
MNMGNTNAIGGGVAGGIGAAGGAVGGIPGAVFGGAVGAVVHNEIVNGGKTTIRHMKHVGRNTVWTVTGRGEMGNIYFEQKKNGPITIHPGDYISYGFTTKNGRSTGSITFSCDNYKVTYSYDGCYIRHRGRTHRMTLNNPADGDVYLED